MSDESIKQALKMLPYGFYSITSRSGNEVNAMVANWVTQASFEPRLFIMGLQKKSYSYGLIKDGGVFALNIFKKEDEEAIMPFTKSRAKNPEKMKGAKYVEGPSTGCPILEGAAAYIEFKVVKMIDIGADHDILVGDPVGADIMKPAEPSDVLSLPHIGWSYAG